MKILYIDNFDSFADLIAGELTKLGHKVTKYDCTVPARQLPENFDTLLLGPGPNDPTRAGNYLETIERFEDRRMRGICLGFQAINQFYGGMLQQVPVCHGKRAKIENIGEGIFQGLEKELQLARYNSLGVRRDHLAKDLVPTAYEVDLVMAYQHKDKDISAVQFHPESVLSGKAGGKILENMFK